ncbi:hypothetical protein FQV11_0015214, partial [Eudyptes moseleyi]
MERMSWLSKLNPRAAGQRAPRSASLQSPVTADPETCLMVFKNHWSQPSRGRRGCKPAPDDLSAVRNNTYQMLNLLAEDRPRGEAARGPILEFVASENLLERLLCWHLQGDFTEERKVEQLKLYEMLISQARQPLLRHKSVLTPLLRLLSLCAEPTSAPLENSLVLLLNQLCVSVAKEPSILELFFHSHTDQGPANLIIFSLLIPFIHHEGVLGQQARDALLLIMAMSASNHAVAKSITDNSYFCPVRLGVAGLTWHDAPPPQSSAGTRLVPRSSAADAGSSLAVALPSCRTVGLLHGTAWLWCCSPAPWDCLTVVLPPALLRLPHGTARPWRCPPALLWGCPMGLPGCGAALPRCCGAAPWDCPAVVLPSCPAAAPSPPTSPQLCMVSLSLFRTLLSLNCEDVMLQLVLRYLLPCSHVMLSQKRAVRDLDIYGKTAAKFLSLIPRCCRPESLPPPNREEEHAAWSKGHGSPNVDTSSVVTVPKPSTPSRLSFFMRQQSAAPEAAGPAPCSPGTPSGSPCHRAGRWEEVSELDRNYLEYLRDARRSIDRCTWACRVWSAPYDGEEPSASGAVPLPDGGSPLSPDCLSAPRPPGPPTPRTKKRGLPEEGVREGQGGPPGSGGEPGGGGPSPEARDSGTLVNGAHGPAEPGRPEGDVAVKKVRRSPQGEGDGTGPLPEREHRPVPAQNGAAAPPAPQPQPPGWEPLPSVDSLIEELLARVPAEPNGAGVTIEAFTEELREIEAEMKNGGGGALPAPQEPPEAPLSREEEEAFASFAALPEGDTAGRALARPPDPLAQLVASPPRAVGPPPSQPFTG